MEIQLLSLKQLMGVGKMMLKNIFSWGLTMGPYQKNGYSSRVYHAIKKLKSYLSHDAFYPSNSSSSEDESSFPENESSDSASSANNKFSLPSCVVNS